MYNFYFYLGNNPKKYEINGVNGFKLTIQDFAIDYNFFQHDIST